MLATGRHKSPLLSAAEREAAAALAELGVSIDDEYLPPGAQFLEFRYDVIRVWQLPLDTILSGGLGILPLAPLADGSQRKLKSVVKSMQQRLEKDSSPEIDTSIWTATYVLMGLRYSREFAADLLRGVRAMKESVTYQAIVEEGIEKGIEQGVLAMREVLLELGEWKFGKPDRKMAKVINAIHQLDQLKLLVERIPATENWQELLRG